MSFDLYFWPSGATKRPRLLAGRLADEDTRGLVPEERVLAFRADLLRRWPELADMISPWHDDLGWRQPWGRTDIADRYVGLNLPYGWAAVSALPLLARAYQLDCYDPQVGQLTVTRGEANLDGAAVLKGWVNEDNVARLFRTISSYIGYRYDDLDEDALVGALDDTDEETGRWFEYPLAGTPPLTVFLAWPPGRSVVTVRVEGTMDLVLSSRVEVALDML
ncbi:hypothetical protein AB0J82_32610 [Asanoa sp. NPDC049518]|uniref:hypothetical protein n=1 Tax=unclassified Asanoa TaxID=2685164 RepID=UPI00341FB45F